MIQCPLRTLTTSIADYFFEVWNDIIDAGDRVLYPREETPRWPRPTGHWVLRMMQSFFKRTGQAGQVRRPLNVYRRVPTMAQPPPYSPASSTTNVSSSSTSVTHIH